MTRRAGVVLIAAAIVAALAAPFLSPHLADARNPSLLNAPPTWPHLVSDDGGWHAPFIYRWVWTIIPDRLYDRWVGILCIEERIG